MTSSAKPVRLLRLDRSGVTALEYGVIAAVMGMLVLYAFLVLGSSLVAALGAIGNVLAPMITIVD